MPDVGVLNLAIQDNSNYAGKGLERLEGALRAVQSAASSYNLSPVVTQLKSVVSSVMGVGSGKNANKTGAAFNKMMTQVTKFANSMTALTKIKSIDFDVKGLENLKKAWGEGITVSKSIGTNIQHIGEALKSFPDDGGGGGAIEQIRSLKTVANDLAKSGTGEKLKEAAAGITVYANSLKKLADAARELKDLKDDITPPPPGGGGAVDVCGVEEAKRSSLMKLNLQQFGRTKLQADFSGIEKATERAADAMNGVEGPGNDLPFFNTEALEEFEEELEECQETASLIRDDLGTGITEDLQHTIDKLNLLTQKARLLREELANMVMSGEASDMDIVNQSLRIMSTDEQAAKYRRYRAQAGEASPMQDFAETYSTIEAYQMKRQERWNKLQEGISSGKFDREKIADEVLMIGRLDDKIAKLQETQSSGVLDVVNTEAIAAAESFMKTNDQVALLNMQIDELKMKMGKGILGGTMGASELARTSKQIDKMKAQRDRLLSAKQAAEEAMGQISDDGETVTGTFTELGASISEAAKSLEQATVGVKENIGSIIPDLEKIVNANAFRPWMYGPQTAGGNRYASMENVPAKEFSYGNINNLPPLNVDYEEAGARKLEAIKKLFSNASDEVQRYIANLYGISPSVFHEFKSKMEETADVVSETVNRIQTDMSGTGMGGNTQIDLLTQKVAILKDELATGIDKGTFDDKKIVNYKLQIESLEEKIRKLKDKEAASALENFKNSVEASGATAGKTTGKLKDLDKEMKSKKDDATEASGAFAYFKEKLTALVEPVKEMTKHARKLRQEFFRMMKRMAMRAIIKEIAKGFSEGVENVYHYSKAIGSSFAPAMDDAATALLQMKNAIGAAVAPAIQMLLPYIKALVNGFISVINHVNQFLALLRGQQTWTRALPAATTAFGKQEKAAKKTGNALKDLLASWDELNIIQSEASGSGSGGTDDAEDYLAMFEEVNTFDRKLKQITDRIKEAFGDAWDLVKKVGLGILGWKVSAAFGSILGTLGGLVASGVIIDLTFRAVTTLDNMYYDTKETGFLVGDILTTLIGGVLMRQVLKKVLGGGLAKLAIPLSFAISAGASIKTLLERTDVSALSEEGIRGAINAALKGGVAAGTGVYSLAGLTAGAAIGTGIAAAAVTFGITIGLKAIADTVKTGEFTAEIIKADFLAAGLVGTGIGIAEAVLGGTVGTLIAASGAGALITLGLLVGIEALIAAQPKSIKWGNKKLTQDQIQNFVNNEIFTTKYSSNFDVYSKQVSLAEGQDQAISEKVAELLPEVQMLKIGINVDTSVNNIRDGIFGTGGLIDLVNEKIKTETAIVKAAITLVPVKDSEGNDLSADVIKQTSEGWGFLKGIMDDLGQSLSEQLAISEKEGIEASAKEMAAHNIAVLTQTMMEVSSALAAGRYMTEMSRDFQEGLTAAMDEGSVKGILDYYEKRKDEVQKGVEAAYQSLFDDVQSQIYTNQILLEEAMKNGGEYAGRNAQEYLDQITNLKGIYQMLLDNQESSIAQAMAFYESGDGKEKIRQAILSMLNVDLKQSDITTAFGGGMDQIMTYIEDSLFSPEGQRYDGAKENLEAVIDNILKSVFGDDYETVKRLVDNNFLSLQDIFGDTLFTELEKVLKVDKRTTEIQEAWTKLRDEIMNPSGDNTVTPPDMTDFNNDIADSTRGLKEWNYWRDKMMSSGSGNYRASVPNLYSYGPRMFATGGFPDSGNLFMADENGNIEMKGRMGTQPVVANNQQIVDGISQGVSNANESVVDELRIMAGLMQRILQKEFTAKVTPSSGLGRVNGMSQAAYDRVTGV